MAVPRVARPSLTEQIRADAWTNMAQQLGTRNDPENASVWEPDLEVDPDEARSMWCGDFLAAQQVNGLPDDASAEGWDIRIGRFDDGEDLSEDDAEELAGDIGDYVDDPSIDLKTKILRALKTARTDGWCYLVFGTSDLGDDAGLDAPLGEFDEVRWIKVFSRLQVTPGEKIKDISDPRWMKPEDYEVSLDGEMFKVHPSRIVWVPGVPVPWEEEEAISALGYVTQPNRRYHEGLGSIAQALREGAVSTFGVKGFASKVTTKDGREQLRKRFRAISYHKSRNNSLPYDADLEQVGHLARPIGDYPEGLDRLMVAVSSAQGRPITHVFGLSPGGFGTGKDEDQRWGQKTADYQREVMRPVIRRAYEIVLAARSSPTDGRVPKRWKIEFRPTQKPKEVERAQAQRFVAETASILFDAGLISWDEGRTPWLGDFVPTLRLSSNTEEPEPPPPPEPPPAPPPPAGEEGVVPPPPEEGTQDPPSEE